MKKSPISLFKNKDYLLDEPEINELITLCEQLQDEIVELEYQQSKSKELVLKEMLSDILKACEAIKKEGEEHKRFGFAPANFEEAIKNLESYIYVRCRDEKIYLDNF